MVKATCLNIIQLLRAIRLEAKMTMSEDFASRDSDVVGLAASRFARVAEAAWSHRSWPHAAVSAMQRSPWTAGRDNH
jgi:hypothetical protein